LQGAWRRSRRADRRCRRPRRVRRAGCGVDGEAEPAGIAGAKRPRCWIGGEDADEGDRVHGGVLLGSEAALERAGRGGSVLEPVEGVAGQGHSLAHPHAGAVGGVCWGPAGGRQGTFDLRGGRAADDEDVVAAGLVDDLLRPVIPSSDRFGHPTRWAWRARRSLGQGSAPGSVDGGCD